MRAAVLVALVAPVALLTLLPSCLPAPGGCDARAELPVAAGCLVPEGGWLEGEAPTLDDQGTWEMQLQGEVLEVGVGEPPDGCAATAQRVGSYTQELPDAAWLRIDDGAGRVWTVGWQIADVTPSVTEGDDVAVSYSYFFGGFSPEVGHLSLRDSADDSLIAWVGDAGTLEQLAGADELAFSQGPAICQEADTCGDWAAYDLVIDGAVDSAWAQTVQHGDLAVVHAGHRSTSRYSNNCADWFVEDVTVGAARL